MEKHMPTAKAVFDNAFEISSLAERKAYVDQACADAPELRDKVEGLLRAHDQAGSFLERPAFPTPATAAFPPEVAAAGLSSGVEAETVDDQTPTEHAAPLEGPGSQIGPYKLLQQLGEGGMGTVYLAEQEQPMRRQVALKIIKPGMDSAQVVARFEAERQALAMMDHVHIARVIDGGATKSSRPYFVMELVKGISLNRFCNQNTLALRERLALFVTVCQAVQHAHQKGVIHRDLKPSNVLVALHEGKPVAKVIDFGLAKAVEQPLTEQSLLTQVGTLLGTPEYMSPEQADLGASGIDTRTDIYSLGVMLYELLTGTTPLEHNTRRDTPIMEMLRRIKEEEAPRPSARVSGLGGRLPKVVEQRKTEPARLVKLLRRELDWIVLKALEKDPNRRYESASGFGQDVQRYLHDEPVEACPPSTRYRLGKFARKHRVLLTTTSVIFVLLVFGIVALTWGLVEVEHARQRAVNAGERARKAEKATRQAFNVTRSGIWAQLRNPAEVSESQKTILRNMLAGYQKLIAELGDAPEARATVAEAAFQAADLSRFFDAPAEAEAGYRRAIALYERLTLEFPDEPQYRNEQARGYFNLGVLLNQKGQRGEAEKAYRRAIELHEKVATDFPDQPAYRSELADVYTNLGTLLRDQQEFAKAEMAFRHAVSLGEKVVREVPDFNPYRINLAASYHGLGNAVRDQHDAKGSLAWYSKAIARLTGIEPRPDSATVFLRNAHWDRANALGQLREHAAAIKDWQEAIKLAAGPMQEHLAAFLAAAQVDEKLKTQDNRKGELLYEAAVRHARATAAAAAEQETGLQNDYGKRAVELLREARTVGFFRDPRRIKQLREDQALNALPNFTPLLESLEAGKGSKNDPEK